MAFGDKIQSASTNTSGVTSITVNFSAATEGNLLIVAVGSSASQTWGTAPADWTLLTQVPDGSGNMSGIWYYKIATGGETSVTVTLSNISSTLRGALCEFEGPFADSPLDQTAENEDNISTPVTSQASGTTGTTTQADELLVAFFAADAANNVDAGRAYTNGFTEEEANFTNSGRAAAILAKLVVAATGTYSTTFSTTDTGDEMYGAIATFKKAAEAGGGSLIQATPGLLNLAGQTAVVAPGGATVTAVSGLLNLAGQTAVVLPGSISLGLAVAELALAGQTAVVLPGSISLGLAVAELALAGQTAAVLPGTVSIQAAAGELAISGQTAALLPGAVAVAVAAGVLSLTGMSLESIGEAAFVSLGRPFAAEEIARFFAQGVMTFDSEGIVSFTVI